MENIPDGERASDSIEIKFVMQKGSDSVKVDIKGYSQAVKDGFKFIRQDRKLIIEGYKSPIHDFAIYDQESGTDLKDEMLNFGGYQLMYIAPFLNTMDTGSLRDMIDLYHASQNKKWAFYALSSSSLDPAKQFQEKHRLPFEFYAADQKMLMTMARYNPTLYLFKGSTVIKKWSGNNLPSVEELSAIK
jgi:triosephosphate isomerase